MKVSVTPPNYNALVRGHWGIENKLHWHLDVTFREDPMQGAYWECSYKPANYQKISIVNYS